jgi:uncharacterized integral membrane protein
MSSTQDRPQVQMQRHDEQQGYGKLIVAGVIAVILLMFVFSNGETWQVKFLFLGPWGLPAWLMLIIILVIGFLLGLVTSALLRRRKKRELKRRARGM